jgi:hypothetical protein
MSYRIVNMYEGRCGNAEALFYFKSIAGDIVSSVLEFIVNVLNAVAQQTVKFKVGSDPP